MSKNQLKITSFFNQGQKVDKSPVPQPAISKPTKSPKVQAKPKAKRANPAKENNKVINITDDEDTATTDKISKIAEPEVRLFVKGEDEDYDSDDVQKPRDRKAKQDPFESESTVDLESSPVNEDVKTKKRPHESDDETDEDTEGDDDDIKIIKTPAKIEDGIIGMKVRSPTN